MRQLRTFRRVHAAAPLKLILEFFELEPPPTHSAVFTRRPH